MAGRNPTISMACFSRSKSCCKSSPSSIFKSCWKQGWQAGVGVRLGRGRGRAGDRVGRGPHLVEVEVVLGLQQLEVTALVLADSEQQVVEDVVVPGHRGWQLGAPWTAPESDGRPW